MPPPSYRSLCFSKYSTFSSSLSLMSEPICGFLITIPSRMSYRVCLSVIMFIFFLVEARFVFFLWMGFGVLVSASASETEIFFLVLFFLDPFPPSTILLIPTPSPSPPFFLVRPSTAADLYTLTNPYGFLVIVNLFPLYST